MKERFLRQILTMEMQISIWKQVHMCYSFTMNKTRACNKNILSRKLHNKQRCIVTSACKRLNPKIFKLPLIKLKGENNVTYQIIEALHFGECFLVGLGEMFLQILKLYYVYFLSNVISACKKSNATNDLPGYGYRQPSVLNGHLHFLNQIFKYPWHFLRPSHSTKTM